ncbi:MAG: ATP synthase subunit I [Vulcanibacillus sp.]
MNSLEDYKLKVIRIAKYTLILLFVYLIGAFTPYSSIFMGLLIGTTVSLINTIYTAWKVNKIGEIAARTEEHGKTKFASTGMLTRTALSLLVILLVLQYPQYFNIYSTLIGLFSTQVISVVDSIKSN